MTLRLNDYTKKLKVADNILTGISLHSKNFPKFISVAIHGEPREMDSDEFAKAEINRFIELEKKADYIIKGHSLPENQRKYFKNATYMNPCIYPKDWIELFNLNECICNKRRDKPKYIAHFDTNTEAFLGEEVVEQTKHYYALRPFQTACILYHELIELYNEYNPDYDLSRLDLPTLKNISVYEAHNIVIDMIKHCQAGIHLIQNNLIRSRPPVIQQTVEAPEIPTHPDNKGWKEIELHILDLLKGIELTAAQIEYELKVTEKCNCPCSERTIYSYLSKKRPLRRSVVDVGSGGKGYYRTDFPPLI